MRESDNLFNHVCSNLRYRKTNGSMFLVIYFPRIIVNVHLD